MTAVADRPSNVALFSLWGLFWVAMVVVSLQEASRNPFIRWWEPLLWEGSSAFMATLWLLAQRRVDARYRRHLDQPRRWLWHHVKWLPLMAPTFIVSIYLIRHGVYGLLDAVYRHDPWAFVFPYETAKLILFVGLWLGIIFGLNSFAQWRSERERLLSVQKALAEAQLAQLQSQLRPHFLFNALNTISSLMHVDAERADRLLSRLGDFLRSSLQIDRSDMASLREELQMLRLYAQIMEERFPDRVAFHWEVADEALDCSVPALVLQPLLENAFRHGVEKSHTPVTVRIAGTRDGEQLWLTVSNTGVLDLSHASGGIGLRNCRERLHVHYGAEAALELRQDGDDVAARVRLPWRKPS